MLMNDLMKNCITLLEVKILKLESDLVKTINAREDSKIPILETKECNS